MFRWIAKIVVAIVLNAIGFWLAIKYISGFSVSGDFKQFLAIAVLFTALNFFLKPILKLVLGPIIILTLGLGVVIVNALIIYILDIFSQNLTIETVLALLYTTLIMSAINVVFHLATKK